MADGISNSVGPDQTAPSGAVLSGPTLFVRHFCTRHWGLMDDLQLYILFNSISVISGQWVKDNERL